MKTLFILLLLLSSYSVSAQEYVKVFDDKEIDYYAYSPCEKDEQDHYMLWTKMVIKPEYLTTWRRRMMIETQSNHYMTLSYIVQLLKYDFEYKRYSVGSLAYYNSEGKLIFEDNEILPLWKYIQPETYIERFFQVAKQFVNAQSQTPRKKDYTGKVYDVVEQMPSFPGGNEALMKYVQDNVKYPSHISKAERKQGRVVVKFVVERDGSVTNVKVARSVSPLLDKEALRVISNMPKWIPGKQNGRTVRVAYNVPVSFRLM